MFTTARFGPVRFLLGALELLENLPKGLKVAALTNGNSDPNKLGFGQYFNLTILAKNYSFQKPDARIFAVSLSKLQLTAPERVLDVGECLKNDVEGALQSGLTSVWYNPAQKPASPTVKTRF